MFSINQMLHTEYTRIFMYQKIKDYVFFKLRNDHASDHLEKKEEIIANLCERYDEILKQTNDEDYAYVETIKTFGNFFDEEEDKKTIINLKLPNCY